MIGYGHTERGWSQQVVVGMAGCLEVYNCGQRLHGFKVKIISLNSSEETIIKEKEKKGKERKQKYF